MYVRRDSSSAKSIEKVGKIAYNSSVYNSTPVELCTELFYAIIPTLFLCFFADLLSLHLIHFQCFFIFVHVTFLAADACLS